MLKHKIFKTLEVLFLCVFSPPNNVGNIVYLFIRACKIDFNEKYILS